MSITKYVQIDFADRYINSIDEIQYIREAVKFVSLNLYARHNVQLQWPMRSPNNKVVLELVLLKEKDSFEVGRHLRGISAYLLKNYHERYEQHLKGKRLLDYTVIPKPNYPHEAVVTESGLVTISEIALLLTRKDEVSIDKCNRIINILREGDNTLTH